MHHLAFYKSLYVMRFYSALGKSLRWSFLILL
jgi:hypothetical protein